MSYQSPIEVLQKQMQSQIEGEIYKAIMKVGVNVDKDELLKALQYDRNQYRKGYIDRDSEIVRCKNCELKEVCITSRGDEWYCGDARPKIEWGKVKGVPAEYEGDARSSWWYVCGECHGRIGDGDAYCKHCGCKIDWE